MVNPGLEKQSHGKQYCPTQSSQNTLKNKNIQKTAGIHNTSRQLGWAHTVSDIFVDGQERPFGSQEKGMTKLDHKEYQEITRYKNEEY